jgi:hypothetical protein
MIRFMARYKVLFIAAAVGTLGLLPTSSTAQTPAECPGPPTPPPLTFNAPTYISKNQAGGEPVSQVAQDGSISVSSHAGTTHIYKAPEALPNAEDFIVGYANQTLNWRSTDGGQTWTYIGLNGSPAGPHTLFSSGFSDPDYTMDAGGRIYNTEINLANVSVYSSSDDGQSYPVGNALAGNGDRPWLTGADPNVVYLYINSTPRKYLQKSTDGGRTFTTVVDTIGGTGTLPATGKLAVDPLNPHHGLIGPMGVTGIAISADDGKTWTQYPGAKLGASTQFFGAPAVDKAGWVYTAAAGGYKGSGDVTQKGEVSFAYFNRTTGKWNPTKVNIPAPPGDAMWPWVIAGDDGRAAIVWYQNLVGKPNEFYAFAAYTLNAHGTTVTCSDGTTKFYEPQFSVANASGRPVHVGDICLDGTNCNADTNFQGGDRRLGDFFTVNYDLNGDIIIAASDTRLPGALDMGPKPVSNPIFIKQNGGASLLEQPIPPRPTRPLCTDQSC